MASSKLRLLYRVVTSPAPASGDVRDRLEDELVVCGLARTHTAAKSLIRDLPDRYARFLEAARKVAPHRLATITAKPEAIMEACYDAVAGAALNELEAELDGNEDLRYERYRNAATPDRERFARESARADFALARVLLQRGHATLRQEGLQ